MSETKIIGVGNHKGGTCKTTNAIHLAAALGERGRKCLLIDLDANLGLTYSFDIPTTNLGTFHMLLGQAAPEDVIITEESRQEAASRPGETITLPKNVDIIPANRRIDGFDEEFAAAAAEDENLKFLAPFDTLQEPINSLKGKYDYILLDTAPNAGSLTLAAYKTAQWFVLSSTAEKLSIDALRRSMKDIVAASRVNPTLQLLGVVMSQVDPRKKLQQTYVTKVSRDLQATGGLGLFEAVVPTRAVVGKASTLCSTVFDYDPAPNEVKSANEVRDVYRLLAKEVEERVNTPEQHITPEVEALEGEIVNG